MLNLFEMVICWHSEDFPGGPGSYHLVERLLRAGPYHNYCQSESVGVVVVFQMSKLRLSEVKSLAQGYRMLRGRAEPEPPTPASDELPAPVFPGHVLAVMPR